MLVKSLQTTGEHIFTALSDSVVASKTLYFIYLSGLRQGWGYAATLSN